MKLQNNVKLLCSEFEGLKIQENFANSILVSGSIEVDSIVCDEHINETYLVQIDIPVSYPNELPIIKELSSKVDNKYSHRYSDSSLCLATEADMHVQLFPNYSLSDYVTKFVLPYFISYEYYKKYKVFPFGERSHGIKGILEFYGEAFGTDTIEQVYDILKYISANYYRGHTLCPCGSDKRIRKCHGKKILIFQQEGILEQVQSDFEILKKIIEGSILKEKRQIIEKYLYETK